jgi:hypothetical protein
MYTLPSEKLMEMTKIQPHEELLSEGERFMAVSSVFQTWEARSHS